MMDINLKTRCQDYLYNLNPIAQKFAKDIVNTREAYQDLWNALSEEEQNQVINENIITPAAVLKYAHIPVPIISDTATTYSWFTKSQLDLFTCLKKKEVVSEISASQLPNVSVQKALKKTNAEITKKKSAEENKHSFFGKLQVPKTSILKPKSPPPPPPTAKVFRNSALDCNVSAVENEANVASSEIPKTGFDFLDNW